MAVQIVIVIGISVTVILSAWVILSPLLAPVFEDVQKGILQSQGWCPDVSINSEAYNYPTTGWFGIGNYCNGYIQIEVTNSGKNQATSAKIVCILEDSNGFKLAWQEKKIGALQTGEVKPLDMIINYNCDNILEAHNCYISFEDPCY